MPPPEIIAPRIMPMAPRRPISDAISMMSLSLYMRMRCKA
jgi:hypothetical protein